LTASAENLFVLDAGIANNLTAETGTVDAITPEAIAKAVSAAKTVTYHWNIASDTIAWSSDVLAVLGCPPHSISTGKKFASHLAADNMTSRYDTVLRSSHRSAHTEGEAFEIEYQFKPEGRAASKSVWVEDHGRWFVGVDGSPADVFGTMRVVEERHLREQELNFLSSCDPLTGMMNRPRMMEALDEAIRNAQADKAQCAVALVRITRRWQNAFAV
jgi:hypothetical protein